MHRKGKSSHGAEKARALILLCHQLAAWPQWTPLTSLSLFPLELNHGSRLDGPAHSLVLCQSLNLKSPSYYLSSLKGGGGRLESQSFSIKQEASVCSNETA